MICGKGVHIYVYTSQEGPLWLECVGCEVVTREKIIKFDEMYSN